MHVCCYRQRLLLLWAAELVSFQCTAALIGCKKTYPLQYASFVGTFSSLRLVLELWYFSIICLTVPHEKRTFVKCTYRVSQNYPNI